MSVSWWYNQNKNYRIPVSQSEGIAHIDCATGEIVHPKPQTRADSNM